MFQAESRADFRRIGYIWLRLTVLITEDDVCATMWRLEDTRGGEARRRAAAALVG